MYVSTRIEQIPESVTLKLNAKATRLAEEGRTIYNLTAGQLPFMSSPDLIEKLHQELGSLKSFQYSPGSGFPALRKKVVAYVEESRGLNFSSINEEIDCMINNGAKHSITNTIFTLVEEGDEIIILSPFWISYPEIIKLAGGIPIELTTGFNDNFVPSLTDLEKLINKKTKAIIINSPNNPAGIYYPADWMEQFSKLMEEYPDVFIVSDEIYYELSYNGPGPAYFYQSNPELLKRTVIIDGISKSFACTGLRIGYCVGPKHFITAMGRLQGQTTSGPNSLVQRALIEYEFSESSSFLGPIKSHLARNASILIEHLEKTEFSKTWYQPTSALYYLLDLSKFPIFDSFSKTDPDAKDFSQAICDNVLDKLGIAMVPGTDFGMPNSARISLVLEEAKFKKAIGILLEYFNLANS